MNMGVPSTSMIVTAVDRPLMFCKPRVTKRVVACRKSLSIFSSRLAIETEMQTAAHGTTPSTSGRHDSVDPFSADAESLSAHMGVPVESAARLLHRCQEAMSLKNLKLPVLVSHLKYLRDSLGIDSSLMILMVSRQPNVLRADPTTLLRLRDNLAGTMFFKLLTKKRNKMTIIRYIRSIQRMPCLRYTYV
jgi:hypothetical protein